MYFFLEDAHSPKQNRPQTKICQAVDLLKRIMKVEGYGLCSGEIYKLVSDATFTFVYCGSVKDYLLKQMGNVEHADVLAPCWQQLVALLSETSCRLIKPIIIDHNYIEVLPSGTCFNLFKKCFEMNPVDLEGSPRAFVKYVYEEGKVPQPHKFIEGMK